MDKEEDVVTVRRAEIDTRAPFRSVKEAVMLFGERVLAGEVYANKIRDIHVAGAENCSSYDPAKIEVPPVEPAVFAELEETKESLKKAREESFFMETCLSSLKQELVQTKKELQLLKQKELEKKNVISHIEDLKYIEIPANLSSSPPMRTETRDFQKRRYVKFAHPPLQSQSIPSEASIHVLQRCASSRTSSKKEKMPLLPRISSFFSRKKSTTHEDETS